MREELDGIDEEIVNFEQKIDDWRKRKDAVKMARSLFERSVAQYGDEIGTGDPFTVQIGISEERHSCNNALDEKIIGFFTEKLASYGLVLVSSKKACIFNFNDTDKTFVFVLKSTKRSRGA